MQSVSKVAQLAVEARSAAREHYAGYRSSYQVARQYRDEVIPLRKKVADETLLRYNGMLVSVFELLADSREQAAAVNHYIDSLKEFWLARTALEAALGGRLPADGGTGAGSAPLPPVNTAPASAPNKEMHHDHS
ncbi:MAG: RND transporter, partial [Massilia sp.]